MHKSDFCRTKKVYQILEKYIKLPKIVHIVGTNGKGSTGRMLAILLHNKSKNVLHFSSPHIFEIEERFWKNNKYISQEEFEEAKNILMDIVKKENVQETINNSSYFEYLFFISIILSNNMDYLILEAGIGGELDTTNVVRDKISLITSISIDHEDILGKGIHNIVLTKIKSIKDMAIFSKQSKEVQKELERYNFADKHIYNSREILDSKTISNIKYYIKQNKMPIYQMENIILACASFEYLGFKIINLPKFDFFGRFSFLKRNIIIDAGHNESSALAILQELNNLKIDKINLIYMSAKNKAYEKILQILLPVIKKLYITENRDKHFVQKEELSEFLRKKYIDFGYTRDINFEDNEYYLIFGSFRNIEHSLNILKLKREI